MHPGEGGAASSPLCRKTAPRTVLFLVVLDFDRVTQVSASWSFSFSSKPAAGRSEGLFTANQSCCHPLPLSRLQCHIGTVQLLSVRIICNQFKETQKNKQRDSPRTGRREKGSSSHCKGCNVRAYRGVLRLHAPLLLHGQCCP